MSTAVEKELAKKFVDMQTYAHFLEDRIREYLAYGSLDGKPVRQELRKELAELVGAEEFKY